MNIKFITSNAAKVSLARERLSKYKINVVQELMDLDEGRSLDVEEVAEYKARQALGYTKGPFIIEDSAFYIESLNGFPGTFVNMAFNTLGDKKISELTMNEKNCKAYMKSVLVYGDPKSQKINLFTGIYQGEISKQPKGNNMRGWKIVRIFIPKGFNKTLAEMDDKEWQVFLDKFRENDHFEKFGKWLNNF